MKEITKTEFERLDRTDYGKPADQDLERIARIMGEGGPQAVVCPDCGGPHMAGSLSCPRVLGEMTKKVLADGQHARPTLAPEIRRFRLAVFCPDTNDGGSLYRAIGPLGAMEKEDCRLQLSLPEHGAQGRELTWDWLWRCDALFVQRPYLPLHVQLLVQAALMGLPVWVDWDDDYLAVHRSHKHWHEFNFPGAAQVQEQLTTLADVVTVTTLELQRRVAERDKSERLAPGGAATAAKIRVVPNACQWPDQNEDRLPRVTWRGAHAHSEDLLGVLASMAELARMPQFRKWEWAFLGEAPWQVAEVMPRDRLLGDFGAEPWLYMEALGRLRPWVHIVPLQDTAFNRCKSNLAWIEATAAGAIVLAPDWEEWQRPGVVHYHDRKDFATKLREVMEWYPAKGVHDMVWQSRVAIEELELKKINAARWEILNRLWGSSREGTQRSQR